MKRTFLIVSVIFTIVLATSACRYIGPRYPRVGQSQK
jgi:hypothetical protein